MTRTGFNPRAELTAIEQDKVRRGRKAWQGFRELCVPKWSEAYIAAIEQATGSKEFVSVLAVTKLKGDSSLWENHQPFSEAINSNPVRIWTFHEMIKEIEESLTTTLAATEVGRLIQLFKASDVTLS